MVLPFLVPADPGSPGKGPLNGSSTYLQADCQEPGSAPETYAQLSSMGYLYLFAMLCCRVSVCPYVHLSQAGTVSKRLDGSNWFLAWRFLSIDSILCFKEMWVSRKIKVLLSGTLNLENFAIASRSCCQQNLSTVELLDHTYGGRRCSWQTVYAIHPLRSEHSLLHVHRLCVS